MVQIEKEIANIWDYKVGIYAKGVFPKWNRTFMEFSESDKSLKHEFGSIFFSWCLGSMLISYTRASRFEYSNLLQIILQIL